MQNAHELVELKAAAFDLRNDIERRTQYYQQLVQQIADVENRLSSPDEPEVAPEPQNLETVG